MINWKTEINWIKIPSGTAKIGSTLEEIEKAYSYWKDRLLECQGQPISKEKFKEWLLKEYPAHYVEVDEFEISDILVTNEMYLDYCNKTNAKKPESLRQKDIKLDHPVWGVSIEEAKSFCKWLSQELGYKFRLPTEVEWEYAARGKSEREYPWGDEFDPSKCNTFESQINDTTPVRYFENGRSYFGLYDMGGNVEEWVDTRYAPYKGGKFIKDDLIEILGEGYYILKGGSFSRGGDLARISRRHGGHPNAVFRFTGFRLVREK